MSSASPGSPQFSQFSFFAVPFLRFGASPFFFDLVLSVTLATTTRAVYSYFDA
jgi:hypothetical protein